MITVVGMQYLIIDWKGALSHSCLLDLEVELKKEPGNKFDKKAIAVHCNNKKIGYIAREFQKNVNFKYNYKITSVGFFYMTLNKI